MSFTILGTGGYLPDHVVTNDDLAAMVETDDAWITQRIGVKSRHISETDSNTDMAVKAGISPAEIDTDRLREILLSQDAVLDTENL